MTAPAATVTTTAQTGKKEAAAGSPYAILKKDDSGLWDAIGSMSGRNAEHAIKKFAEHGNYATGTFIAIAEARRGEIDGDTRIAVLVPRWRP
jgi:hypothetical protein